MDIVLKLCDEHIFAKYIYTKDMMTEDSILRQFIGLSIIVNIGAYLLYFIASGCSFIFVYDKRLMKHPLFLENQIAREIKVSCSSIPLMSFLTILFFLLEIRGYSKLYDSVDESAFGWLSIPLSFITFVLFTDCLIYWIHRGLHLPALYKRLHKTHHMWKVPTPFASHAINPIDGFLESLPYHLYAMLFPMNKYLYILMFVAVNFWAVSVHDGDFRVPKVLKGVVNGSAHHSDHHLFTNYNYGQFFTLWDRIGKTIRHPSAFEKDSPPDKILDIDMSHLINNNEEFKSEENFKVLDKNK